MIGYRLLGPLEVIGDGTAVDLGGLKQRALLAILLLHANQPVQRDALIGRLWGEHPPAGAEHAVNVSIWRLRKALQAASGTHGVATRQGAYLLQATAEQVDVVPFERLADQGRRALALWRARRWPISGSSRSRRPRSPGWRNCGRGGRPGRGRSCARASWACGR